MIINKILFIILIRKNKFNFYLLRAITIKNIFLFFNIS